jgi:hypothetical protein
MHSVVAAYQRAARHVVPKVAANLRPSIRRFDKLTGYSGRADLFNRNMTRSRQEG